MTQFISINDNILINGNEVRTVHRKLSNSGVTKEDFIGIDVETKEEAKVDFIECILALIVLKNGKNIRVMADIYSDEDFDIQIEQKWKELMNCFGIEARFR